MSYEVQSESFDFAQRETVYLRRRVRDEADAAASAHSLAATLAHVELATAYAVRCRSADDRAWIADHRIW